MMRGCYGRLDEGGGEKFPVICRGSFELPARIDRSRYDERMLRGFLTLRVRPAIHFVLAGLLGLTAVGLDWAFIPSRRYSAEYLGPWPCSACPL
jgi:hypothetical protein